MCRIQAVCAGLVLSGAFLFGGRAQAEDPLRYHARIDSTFFWTDTEAFAGTIVGPREVLTVGAAVFNQLKGFATEAEIRTVQGLRAPAKGSSFRVMRGYAETAGREKNIGKIYTKKRLLRGALQPGLANRDQLAQGGEFVVFTATPGGRYIALTETTRFTPLKKKSTLLRSAAFRGSKTNALGGGVWLADGERFRFVGVVETLSPKGVVIHPFDWGAGAMGRERDFEPFEFTIALEFPEIESQTNLPILSDNSTSILVVGGTTYNVTTTDAGTFVWTGSGSSSAVTILGGSLTVSGSLILSGSSTYSGAVNVSIGALLTFSSGIAAYSGSLIGGGTVKFSSGALISSNLVLTGSTNLQFPGSLSQLNDPAARTLANVTALGDAWLSFLSDGGSLTLPLADGTSVIIKNTGGVISFTPVS